MCRAIAKQSKVIVFLLLAVGLWAMPAAANSPAFAGVGQPDGVQRGVETTIGLYGARLTGTEQVLFYEPGIEVTKIEVVADNHVNVTLNVAPECRLGEHPLRLRTKYGWTGLHTIYVGPYSTVMEAEPNSAFDKPQAVALNSTVSGIVDTEDVDYYIVEAKKGQRISAEVEGIRIAAVTTPPFDPAVAIMDMKRFELSAADDTALLKQDCFASIIAPEDGQYVIQVRESAYGGNGNCRYRVHIGEFPRPKVTFPLGGKPGESVKLKYIGDPSGDFEMDYSVPTDAGDRIGLLPEHLGHQPPSPNWFRVSPLEHRAEAEPNRNFKEATKVAGQAPVAFDGILEADGDHDWFAFEGKAGQTVDLRIFARGLGSPIDPVVNIWQTEGESIKHLGGNDDAGGNPDAVHRQQLPVDGTYYVRVRDHLDKGGPDYGYRLEVAVPAASMTITMPDVARYDDQNRQFVSVPRGNRWMMLLQANRVDFGGPVKIIAEELPPGVTMNAPIMPGNVSQIPVVFEATADAEITGKLIRLRAHHAENESIAGEWVQTVALSRGDPNQTPYYNTSVKGLPVAVTAEAPFKVSIEAPKVPLARDGQMDLRILAERAEGFDEPINVQLPFRPPGLGATSQVTIPKGANEVYYPINANGGAAPGDWPMVVLAFANANGGPTFVSSDVVNLTIAPHIVTGTVAMAVTEQGQKTDVIVQLNHVTAFEGDATLNLIGLPPNCTTEAITVKAGQEQAVFKVQTAADSPVGQHKSLFCQIVVPSNGDAIRQNLAGGGVIRIDAPKPKVVAEAPKPQPQPAAAPAPAEPEAPKKVLTRLEQLRLEQQQKANQQ